MVYVLPQVLVSLRGQPWRLAAVQGEFAVALCTVLLFAGHRRETLVRRILGTLLFILWILMWDEYLNRKFLQENTLLYDQLFLAKHLKFLIRDLWSWKIGAALAILAVLLVVAFAATQTLMRTVAKGAAAFSRPKRGSIVAATLAVLSVASIGPEKGPMAVWATPRIAQNIRESVAMYHAIRKTFGTSPYLAITEKIRLTRKPTINLFLVESYGRILTVDETTGPQWKAEVERIERDLKAQGWFCVTAFSVAPVSGGRSWLAEATLLSGIRVRYEAVFRHLVQEMESTPNLVLFLASQGYETTLLAPKERELQGLPLENHFGYDHTIRRDDLEYTGKRVGWGEIPDQYTLEFSEDTLFSKISAPQFVNFHMVSSHAPWSAVPRLVSDWRSFNDGRSEGEGIQPEQNLDEVFVRLRRFRRVEPRFTYMGEMDQLKVGAYWRSIRYDLRVIQRYLQAHRDDRLVLVLGDHQPPFISTIDGSYDVPLHVFARDPALLEEFRRVGFIDGMAIDPADHPVLLHEGLFSLMLRVLARCCSERGAELPEVDLDGVPL